ncbi:MAG: hypothetical protein F2829_19975, partial [Actinobacteria bacterium]|nr:hypothetical protein [Actinomycetota bacterium]
MSDLLVDSAALRSAATTVAHAVREAQSLPLVAASAWIAYDAGPGPVGTAAVHFLEATGQSLL